jgi:hypothetical protein
MSHSSSDWAPLQPILNSIIQSHDKGLSEFELFDQLKSPPYELFAADALSNPLSLFQSHFILFNALYQLQDSWLSNKSGLLEIHYSCIRKSPWKPGQAGLVNQDKLRIYYLDWSNLNNTDQAQVENMLDNFWQAFSGFHDQDDFNHMPQQQALDILNLTKPYSTQQLKQQYRKMLHKLHPDKGGNNSQTVELHHAYQQLKTHG